MTPQRVFDRLDDLLDAIAGGRAWHRAPMDKHADSLSGAPFERVYAGDTTYILKHISRADDWIMRVLGDGVDGAAPWALTMWREGLMTAAPPEIDTVVVGMAYDATAQRLHQVMRDAGEALVPAGAGAVPLAQHRGFLDHMAALHATFWGFRDRYGLLTPARRYGFAHPDRGAEEAAAGHTDPVPRAFSGGWAAVRAAFPEAADAALALAADPRPLVAAQADGPHTLVHGDWKFGNLGSWPDGRTVLLDWGWPGEAGPAVDLAWYLAVNCDRLPESKEDTIEAARAALERRGVRTTPWWGRQLELALLGGFLQLGWSKSGDELAWWAPRALTTARSLL